MPFVIKSHPRDLNATRTPSVDFTEWSYEGARPNFGADAAWFTCETSGGYGLYALGRISSNATDAGKNAKNNNLVSFSAEFYEFEPRQQLGKAEFQELPRTGSGSPIQELNRRLRLNSHVKVAEIDDETFKFLVSRF